MATSTIKLISEIKEQLGRLDERVLAIQKSLNGNGGRGINKRIDILEELAIAFKNHLSDERYEASEEKEKERQYKDFWYKVLLAVIAAGIGLVVNQIQ